MNCCKISYSYRATQLDGHLNIQFQSRYNLLSLCVRVSR